MYKVMKTILSITNRSLCTEDFLIRIESLAASEIAGIILREKDLSLEEYTALAKKVLPICQSYNTPCIFHTFSETAMALHHPFVHMPLSLLRAMSPKERQFFTILGASCHSLEDVLEAEDLGCTYVTASHIFPTDCKKGIPPKGLPFLKNICEHTKLPVYALGGITASNAASVLQAGAHGYCIMSGLMTCENPKSFLTPFPAK